jgi:hypothetical protein
MNAHELREALRLGGAHQPFTLESGELQGPWLIERAVHLIGDPTLSTVLWARRGPVVTIRGGGVRLENVAIEVTEETDGIALVLEDRACSQPPTFVNVRLLGRAEGFPSGRRFLVPRVIDLGRIAPNGGIRRSLDFETHEPPRISVQLTGLTSDLQPHPLRPAGSMLALTYNGNGLQLGWFLEGTVEIAAGGLVARVRVCGVVDSAGQGPLLPPPGSTALPMPEVSSGPRVQGGNAKGPRPNLPNPAVATPTSILGGDDVLRQARDAVQTDDLLRAEAILMQAVQKDSENPQLLGELAQVQERAGHYDRAAAVWRALAAAVPHDPAIRRGLARCLTRQEHFAQAVQVLEEAVQLPAGQDDAEVLRALAQTYANVGRFREAVWALDRAQAIDPSPRLEPLRRLWQRQESTVRP